MKVLANKMRSTQPFRLLTNGQLLTLLEESEIQNASVGDIIIHEDEPMQGHLILIEGEIESQRTWSVPDEKDNSYTWVINAEDGEDGFGYLSASNRIRARAAANSRYLIINADKIDELIAWDEQFSDVFSNNPVLKDRMQLVKKVGIFFELPFENIQKAFERMTTVDVEAGQTIITQGEKGSNYYIIESGQCDVIQTDPFTDETSCVAKLGPGDSFGEEALLQEAYRNATVTMTIPGRLLLLSKNDFDELLKSEVVEEITQDAAIELVTNNEAHWLDCRYDMEYEESRIPGASLASLANIRKDIYQFDTDTTYIVYCRSGKRSKAAAYLLRERNIKAKSLVGGIKNWTYEIDAEPLE